MKWREILNQDNVRMKILALIVAFGSLNFGPLNLRIFLYGTPAMGTSSKYAISANV